MRIKSYAFSRIWGCLMATLHYWRHSPSYKANSCSSIKLLVTSLAGMRAELIAPSQQQRERERDCNNWPRPCRGWPPAVAFIYFGLAGACLVYFPLVTCVDYGGLLFSRDYQPLGSNGKIYFSFLHFWIFVCCGEEEERGLSKRISAFPADRSTWRSFL